MVEPRGTALFVSRPSTILGRGLLDGPGAAHWGPLGLRPQMTPGVS